MTDNSYTQMSAADLIANAKHVAKGLREAGDSAQLRGTKGLAVQLWQASAVILALLPTHEQMVAAARFNQAAATSLQKKFDELNKRR